MTVLTHIISRSAAQESGLKWYFTGKPCLRGHIEKRLVSNKTCGECMKSSNQGWKDKNPEAVRAAHARYSAKVDKEVLKERGKKSRLKHRDSLAAAAKAKREALGEQHRAENRRRMRKWREENPEAYKAARDKFRSLNPGVQRAYSHSRRIKTGAGMTARQLSDWVKAQDKRCFYCDCACESSYHVDHIVPLAKGGEHRESNLVIACAPCNLAKGACDAVEFLDRIMMQHDVWPQA